MSRPVYHFVPEFLIQNLLLLIQYVNDRGGVEDRPSRGQGHKRKCSPKKRKSSKIFFKRSQEKGLQKIFSSEKGLQNFFRRFPLEENKKRSRKFSARFLALSNKVSTVQKIVLSSSRGQGNFRVLKASRPRTSKCLLEDSTSGQRYTNDPFVKTVSTCKAQIRSFVASQTECLHYR